LAGYAPLLIVLGLLYSVSSIIRSIVLEKELRQKELMKMMSVTESDIGWSWFTSYFVFHIITSICCAIASASLYDSSSFVILLVFWLLSFISIITFCFAISAVFSKATTATLVGLLIFFVGYFLTLTANFKTGSGGVISLVSIHPVTAISYGIQEIGRLEDAGVGLVTGTMSTTDSPSGYTFTKTLTSLFIASFFWGFLTFYLNRVIRSEYGQPLPWYFLCTKSYWLCGSGGKQHEVDDKELDHKVTGVPVEEVTDAVRSTVKDGKGIAICGLRKQFGEKTAVDNLYLNMYTNQITALLGKKKWNHNIL
jgi:ABC-type multidrug transport system fused ATPase/permease subunit